MQIRKLDRQEHGKTRELYEKVFCEDTKEFVDYYYSWKIRDNTIFVAEDDRGIHAMLHLNPFDVYVNGKIEKLHYIVAVATQEEYRHQGLMRRLLAAAEQEMAANGELFTFLMPASEKIYLPFGYRYFAEQKQGILSEVHEAGAVTSESDTEPHENNTQGARCPGDICLAPIDAERRAATADSERPLYPDTGKNTVYAAEIFRRSAYRCRPVKPTELQQLADMVNQILREQYDVFVWRDASYYERLCAEQACQNGAVMVVVCKDENGEEQLIGTFCTACEEEDVQETVNEASVYQYVSEETVQREVAVHVRELILDPDHCEAGLEAVSAFCSEFGKCRIEGFNIEESAPKESAVKVLEDGQFLYLQRGQLFYRINQLLMGKQIGQAKAERESERSAWTGRECSSCEEAGLEGGLWTKRIFINEVV